MGDGLAKTINPIDEYVGSRVRAQRKSLGLTQTQLGAAVGVSFQQIANYEKGACRVGASRLNQIAKTLGVAPSFFYEDGAVDLTAQPEGVAAALLATAEGEDLLGGYLRIQSPRMRRVVIRTIEELADAADYTTNQEQGPTT